MLQTRIIPCLQLIDESLVKAYQFNKFGYIGDPCNTVRIFNELEVDELCFLDIRASLQHREPNLKILQEISDECFMPLSYGGGITTFEQAKNIFSIGFEKIVLNTQAFNNPKLITEIANHFGTQAVVVSIDVRLQHKQYNIYLKSGTEKVKKSLTDYVKEIELAGAGEILLTNIDKEGTWSGFDEDLVKTVASISTIPVIANAGCGNLSHIKSVVNNSGASAVATGSMVVYQKKGFGVLVNFPNKSDIDELWK